MTSDIMDDPDFLAGYRQANERIQELQASGLSKDEALTIALKELIVDGKRIFGITEHKA